MAPSQGSKWRSCDPSASCLDLPLKLSSPRGSLPPPPGHSLAPALDDGRVLLDLEGVAGRLGGGLQLARQCVASGQSRAMSLPEATLGALTLSLSARRSPAPRPSPVAEPEADQDPSPLPLRRAPTPRTHLSASLRRCTARNQAPKCSSGAML